jgi:PAS domain S-box
MSDFASPLSASPPRPRAARIKSLAVAYGVALAVTLVACMLRTLLNPIFGEEVPFITFFPAVALAAWYGGRGAAAVSALLVGLYFLWQVSEPPGSWRLQDPRKVLQLLLFLGSALIITFAAHEHRWARETAREREEQFRALVEHSPAPVARFDRSLRLLYVNPAVEALLGREAEKLVGRTLTAVLRDPSGGESEALRQLRGALERVFASGAEAQEELVIEFEPGRKRWYQVRFTPEHAPESGAVDSVLTVAHDITGRVEAEAAVRRSEERLRAFAESDLIGILHGDADGRIQAANDEYLRIVGRARKELESGRLRWDDATAPEYAALDRERVAQALREGACSSYEKECLRPDGSRVPVLAGFVAVGEERSREVVAFVMDITRQKATEARLAEALEYEHRIAEALQRALLIRPRPRQFAGLAVATVYQSALDEARIGGDFYDFFAVGDGRVALVVGDVAGKGLAAAMRTAEARFALRSVVRDTAAAATATAPPGDPARVAVVQAAIERLNDLMCAARRLDEAEERGAGFIVLTLMVIDPATGEAVFACAGSEPPMILRGDGTGGAAEVVLEGGPPLCVEPGIEYPVARYTVQPGDTVLLLTDGLTEARRNGEFFGLEGVTAAAREALARRHTDEMSPGGTEAALRAAGEEIVAAARAHTPGERLQDDACLLLVRRLPAGVSGEPVTAARVVPEAD